MKTYRARAALYVDERYIREGETFASASPPGDMWEEVKPHPLDHDGDGRKGGGRAKPAPAGSDD